MIGLGLPAAGVIWFLAAGQFEARRIDSQRESRLSSQTRPARLRIDSDRLMANVTALADPKFEGRAAGSPGGIAARAWIVEQIKTIGLETVSGAYVFPFTFSRMSVKGKVEGSGANVIAQCLGADTRAPAIVVSAHYDHLGVRDGAVFHGADDNASGVAVLLELAAYCRRSPLGRTIVFAFFDAEEGGLQGARVFIGSPPLPLERIALNVNLDMVSRSDKREIFVAGTYHYPQFKAPLDEVAKRAPITVLFGHDRPAALAGGVDDWTTQSDHGPFHGAKIPFVYFGVEDHADYHKPTDTADKISRGFFVDAAETILDALLQLDAFLTAR